MFERRISIFTGHFGSGKTEVAVNYALEASRLFGKTAIVDFDIVNPFFRTNDVRSELEKENLWVVSPTYANTNIDVPALPPEIYSVFLKKEYKTVLDVGGDDLGAKVLSRFRDEIVMDDYEVFAVVNTRRPMTDTPEKIEGMIREIEASSRLKVGKLVNNTNLLGSTTFDDILNGQEIIKKVSDKLEIGIGFISVMRDKNGQIDKAFGNEVLYMEKLIRLPWDQ